MRQWYYIESGEQKGPIVEEQFASLFRTGQLNAETLVWTSDLKDWTKAKNVKNLVSSELNPTPLPTMNANVIPPTSTPEFDVSGPQVRPWVRWWARYIDWTLFVYLCLLFKFVNKPFLESMVLAIFIGYIIMFIYFFIEPIMLSLWGTTPGKALLKVRLRKADGCKLSYMEALKRCVSVNVFGLGLGIPIITLVTQMCTYFWFKKDGITSWDKNGDYKILHRTIGTGRVILIIVLYLILFALMQHFLEWRASR